MKLFKKHWTKKYLKIIKYWLDIYNSAYGLKTKLCYDEIDCLYFVVVRNSKTYESDIFLQLRKNIRKELKNKFKIYFTFDEYCFDDRMNTEIIYKV